MTEDVKGLKPCPFCDSPAEHDSQRWQPKRRAEMQEMYVAGHAVTCSKCEAEVGVFDTEEEAVAAWNRRDEIEALTKLVAELRRVAFSKGTPQAAEIEALRKQVADLGAALIAIEEDGTEEHNAAVKLRQEVAALRLALAPFAKIEVPDDAGDGTWVAKTLYCNDQVTAASVFRARRALSATDDLDGYVLLKRESTHAWEKAVAQLLYEIDQYYDADWNGTSYVGNIPGPIMEEVEKLRALLAAKEDKP